MALSNEVKVGILGLCALIGLFWGYNFLKGKNVFSSGLVINAVFDNVEGLQIAAPVTINGFQVGAVTNIYLEPGGSLGKVIAELSLNPGTNLPKAATTEVVMTQPSIMGGKAIELRYVGECKGEDCYKTGDRIQGRVAGMLDGIKPMLDPYLERIDSISILFARLMSDEKGHYQQLMNDVRGTMANLNAISAQVNNILVSSSVNLSVTVANLRTLSDELRANNAEIGQVLKNVNTITQQVKDGDIEKLLKESSNTISTMNQTIASLQTTVQKANATLDQVKAITNLEQHNGLISKLIYDKEFAKDLQVTVLDMQYLLRDIRLHPERYRTVLSNKKKAYNHTPIEEDPAHKEDKK